MSSLSISHVYPGFRHDVCKMLAVSGLLMSLLAPAYADDMSDVTKLLRAGQLSEALSKADAYLGQSPQDAQMRFLKGVILTEQNKSAEAIAIFTKLTQDFPDLPEPYNNLAVLYASSSQYEKARAALDMAIRTNPSYATAYENLGDIHAKLASQAYDKALQLDSANSGAKSKLTLLRSLGGNTASNRKPVVASAKPVAAPVQVAAAKPEPVAKVEAKQPAKVEKNDADQDAAINTVYSWAKAWSDQKVKNYLSYYSDDFREPNGMSRADWEKERYARIENKGRINVTINSPKVTIDGDTAKVRFYQSYVSDTFKANGNKVLTLKKQGGAWRILQEQSE